MSKVSVIIPVYNGKNYLKQCLDSVLQQSFCDWEALLINDGSTDGSEDILKEYALADERFILINQVNAGQSAARNKALSLAKGDYVSFVDADDWISPDFLQKLYDAAEVNQADMAVASIVKVKNNSKKDRLRIKQQKVYETAKEKYKALGMPQNCFIWNKLYKRQILQCAFVEGMYYEDIVFSHEILWLSGKIVTVPEAEYYYYSNPVSTVNVFSEKKRSDYKKALEKALDIMKRNKMPVRATQYDPIIKKNYKFLGLNWLTVKDWGLCKAYYIFGFLKIRQENL